MFEFKEEYLIGIEYIDNQHKRLFELANEIYDVLNNEYIADKYDNAVVIVNELKDYTKKHFADEEKYMEEIKYKKIFTQKIQHEKFIEKLDNIDIYNLDGEHEEVLFDLLNFLIDWLVNHILECDMLIGK